MRTRSLRPGPLPAGRVTSMLIGAESRCSAPGSRPDSASRCFNAAAVSACSSVNRHAGSRRTMSSALASSRTTNSPSRSPRRAESRRAPSVPNGRGRSTTRAPSVSAPRPIRSPPMTATVATLVALRPITRAMPNVTLPVTSMVTMEMTSCFGLRKRRNSQRATSHVVCHAVITVPRCRCPWRAGERHLSRGSLRHSARRCRATSSARRAAT